MTTKPPANPGAMRVEVLDQFQFTDGVRWAWVTWVVGRGERYATAVREIGSNGPVLDELYALRRRA